MYQVNDLINALSDCLGTLYLLSEDMQELHSETIDRAEAALKTTNLGKKLLAELKR